MAKSAITIISSIETYKNLTTFQSVKELNDAIRSYKEKYSADLSKNQLAVLNLLHRYSCKYPGVSFLSKSTIAEMLQISRRTVIRVCQYLESLGIIKQLEMKRKSDMQQTSNAIIIQKIVDVNNDINIGTNDDVDTQDATEINDICHTKKTNSISKTKSINNNTRTGSVNQQEIIDKIVPDSLNNKFGKYALQFWNVKQVKEFYRIALINSKSYDFDKSEWTDIALESFKQLIYHVKHSRVDNPFGYFTGIIRKKLKMTHVNNLFEDVWAALPNMGSWLIFN